MTGNHVLPELRALSWSINCYNCYTEQQPGHRHATKGCPGSCPVKTDIVLAFFFLPFLFFDSSEDISFHEPVESSFSHQVLLLNDTARGSATLSHIKSPRCQIKSREWVKNTRLSDFDEGTMLGSAPQKVDNTRQKNINYDRLCWVGSLQCPHTRDHNPGL